MRTGNVARLLPSLILAAGFVAAQTPSLDSKLTPQQLESTLALAKIDFTKRPGANAGSCFYDFTIRDFNLRLTFTSEQPLMLDTLFPALTPDKVKQWNASGKSSRAALADDDKKASYSVLEAQLDLKKGVTGPAIREFVAGYVKELAEFELFFKEAASRANEEESFTFVLPARLEKTLTDLKIAYAKVPLKGGHFAYRYHSKETLIVLTNWGKDMMLEAKFAKIPVEQVNRYNLERKFIRAVAYKNKLGEYSGLEANLSFQGGLTDSILRNFIAVFEEDVREFGEHVKKAGI